MTTDEVQSRIASITDQNQDTADIGTDDYALRLKLINQRENMWAQVTDWPSLFAEYHTMTSLNSGNVTVSLPGDFRKPAGFPQIAYDGTNSDEFTEISKQAENQHDSSDRYVYYLGTPGYDASMIVHPGTATGFMATGASIYVPYYRSPASLVSPANSVMCPNPDYLVAGVVADLWESQDDPKYLNKKAEADQILANMMEREFTPSEASSNKWVKTTDQTLYNHRWGS